MTLGDELRKAREKAGLSQETVAFDSGLDRSHLSDIERGVHMPTVETFLKICKAIGVKAAEIIQVLEG
jgi:transcriptional regulator with XRE-family HTH domain